MDAEAVKRTLKDQRWLVRIIRNEHPVLSGELGFVVYKCRG
jgi:hypothetical protein